MDSGCIALLLEKAVSLRPPEAVELDQPEHRPDSHVQERQKRDDEAGVARPAFSLFNPIGRRPRAGRAQQGEPQDDAGGERVRGSPGVDDEKAAQEGADGPELEQAGQAPDGVEAAIFDDPVKQESPPRRRASGPFAKGDVRGRAAAGDVPEALVSQRARINAAEKVLARAE